MIATAKWDDHSLKTGRFMRFGTNNRAIVERLIWTTRNPRLRMSSHVHTRYSDLDLFFETLAEAAA